MTKTIRRLRSLFGRIRSRTFNFGPVPQCDVLILFTDTAHYLEQYFPGKSIQVLDIESGERYFRSILRCMIRRTPNMASYLTDVINKSNATLVLSMQDNFLQMYFIQENLRSAHLVLLQNGLRSSRNDLESELRRAPGLHPSVGSYFAFNHSSATRISDRVNCKTLVIGSFRSNHVRRSSRPKRGIAYISTYNPQAPLGSPVGSAQGAPSVTYGDVLSTRLAILKSVQQYSDHSRHPLTIIGKRDGEESLAEYQFYSQALKHSKFDFRPRAFDTYQYEACDEAFIVVSTSSTLGYESLSRGNRTVFFVPDSKNLSDESLAFGWPANFPAEGPFWSTEASHSRVVDVLNNVNSMTMDEWHECQIAHQQAFPIFDSGNSIFVDYLASYGAELPSNLSSAEPRHQIGQE